MSELVQIRKKAQLTLPASVRQKLGIEEGDFVDVQIKDGDIVLKVMKLINREQAWFWTQRWQNGEKEAEKTYTAAEYINSKTVTMPFLFSIGKAVMRKKTQAASNAHRIDRAFCTAIYPIADGYPK